MDTHTSARKIFGGLILAALFLLGLIIRPFFEAFIFAAVLAGALHPLQVRLVPRLRGRKDLSAGVLCLVVVLALLVPFGGIAAFVVRESVSGARFVVETINSEGVTGLIDQLPNGLHDLADDLLERFPIEEEEIDATLQEQASAQGGKAARAVTGALAATGSVLVQTVMMLIALFFLLIDGVNLVAWIEQVSPLAPGQTLELLREFRKVSVSVLASTIATAGVQAAAALLGYLVSSLPHPFFFATVTFFTAFIPAVGAGGMCLVGALWLFLQGKAFLAGFLAVWGIAVVGLMDNIIKPLLVRRGLEMHGAVVFFALLGGLAAFGTVGLLLGPLLVTFFLALVRIYQRDYGADRASSVG
ncbi:MAG: AI-2E family transporter [Myxococcales bacterium]